MTEDTIVESAASIAAIVGRADQSAKDWIVRLISSMVLKRIRHRSDEPFVGKLTEAVIVRAALRFPDSSIAQDVGRSTVDAIKDRTSRLELRWNAVKDVLPRMTAYELFSLAGSLSSKRQKLDSIIKKLEERRKAMIFSSPLLGSEDEERGPIGETRGPDVGRHPRYVPVDG